MASKNAALSQYNTIKYSCKYKKQMGERILCMSQVIRTNFTVERAEKMFLVKNRENVMLCVMLGVSWRF